MGVGVGGERVRAMRVRGGVGKATQGTAGIQGREVKEKSVEGDPTSEPTMFAHVSPGVQPTHFSAF